MELKRESAESLLTCYPVYTEEELKGKTKRDLAKMMGLDGSITFDYALPQAWLDDTVRRTGLDYHLVLGTTFWVYDDSLLGRPVTGCLEVANTLLKL